MKKAIKYHQTRIDQVIENNYGTVINRPVGRPRKPPSQSKGPPKPVRFYPIDEKHVDTAIRDGWESFQEFAEFYCTRIGTVLSRDQAEKFAEHFEKFLPLLDSMP